ncbi:GDSL-type esterase/lipase family protein [Thermoproteota archaeon]
MDFVFYRYTPFIVEVVKSKIKKDSLDERSYEKNIQYKAQTSLYELYAVRDVKIVMAGDSITYGVSWNDLLGRSDVANRGIGGDISEGLLHRLKYIYALKPRVCFIMMGVNDLQKDMPVEDVFNNYQEIIKGLIENNIIPIVQSTLYTEYPKLNTKIKRLNGLLKKYSSENSIEYVDLNEVLASGDKLIEDYTYDGVHLLGSGYDKWRQRISIVLKKHNL